MRRLSAFWIFLLPLMLIGCDTIEGIDPTSGTIARITQGYEIDPTEECSGHDKQNCLGYTYDKAKALHPDLQRQYGYAVAGNTNGLDARTFIERIPGTEAYSGEFLAAMEALAKGEDRKAFINGKL